MQAPRGELDVTWDDILWAAVTVGRPSLHYVFQHGRASEYEALFRWSLIRMALGIRCEQTTPPSVATVFYTDYNPEGKIKRPAVDLLVQAAIASVAKAAPGKDGITYLLDAMAAGIKMPLTGDSTAEILRQTATESLGDALRKLLQSACPIRHSTRAPRPLQLPLWLQRLRVPCM